MRVPIDKLYKLFSRVALVIIVFGLSVEAFGAFTITVENDTVCFGNKGTLIVRATGGTMNYTYDLYEWPITAFNLTVGPTLVDTAAFENLSPRRYLVVVHNDDGSTDQVALVDVIEDSQLDAGSITVTQALTCSYSSNLILRANPSNGSPPYSYVWHNGIAEGQTGQEATGLDASQLTYSVEISDAHGCGPFSADAIRGLTFTVPSAINISSVTSTLTCEGTQNGTITINASGGTGGLSYAVVHQATSDSTAQASNTFSGMGSGWYTPWAIDANSCSVSAANVLVDSAPQPIAPGLIKNPNVVTVCEGQTLTVDTTSGSGGAGTANDEFRYSTDNGTSWSSWSGTIPSFAAIIGTNLIESRRTSTSSGCTTSPSNQVSWTVVAQPVAPGITKDPVDASVCEGTTLTVTTTPGSGGAGTTADEYRYSTDNGTSWSAWGAGVPSFAAVTGTNLIESRRTADGTGCTTSPSNQVSWAVEAQPIAPGITRNPDVNDVCEGTSLTVTTTPGSGGAGTTADEYRYSTDNGTTWSAWGTSVPNFAAVTGTNLIESRRTADGTGCTTSASNQVSWNVNQYPSANAGFDGNACGLDHNLFAFASIGTGTWSQILGPGSVVSWNPDQNSAITSVSVDNYGTYEFLWTENNNGCIDKDTVQVIFSHEPQSYAGTDGSICNDSTYSILDADTNYTNSIVWVSSGTGTFSPSDGVIAPTYTPSQEDRDSGSVWLYLEAYGHPSCLGVPDIDSLELLIAPELRISIGEPVPFPIGPDTKIQVHLKTSGHAPNQDMSYHLVSPDGQKRVVLKESPNKYLPIGMTDCNYGYDVDLYFTTERAVDDTLQICTGGPNPSAMIEDTVNATGAWDSLYGYNPAQGGWTIEIHDYILLGSTFRGGVTEYAISFIDTNTATGLLEEIKYEVTGDSVIINDGPGWPSYGTTRLEAKRELSTSCFGSCDAQAIVTVNGGISPYASYNWNPLPFGGNGSDSVLLCSGTFNLTLTDALGCQAIDSITVVDPPELLFTDAYYTDTLLCNSDSTGQIVIKAAGGRGTISYELLPGNIPSESADSGLFSNLPAGTYTIRATDGSNCFIDSIFTIVQPTPIVIDTAYITDAIYCYGDTTGRIVTQVSGGTPGYTYLLEPLKIANDSGIFMNLAAGDYVVKVTDANSCDTVLSDTIKLAQPVQLDIDTVLIDSIACFGDLATLSIVPVGGVANYNVSIDSMVTWLNNVADTAVFNGLTAGDYDIFVEDANGCLVAYPRVTLSEPTGIVVDEAYFTDSVLCNADSSGYIVVKASGGTGTISYELNPGAIPSASADSGLFENLAAGSYTVSVIDGNTCNVDTSFTIGQPDTIVIDTAYVQDSLACFADANAVIVVSALGGRAPYSYILLPDADTNNTGIFTDLGPGNYFIKVTDAFGCDTLQTKTFEINTPGPLLIDTVITGPIVCTGDLGSITVVGFGGTAPFNVSVDSGLTFVPFINGDTTIVTGLAEGDYNVAIEDANGCRIYNSTTTTIQGPPSGISIDTINITDVTGCYGTDNGAIEIIASGGWGTLSYSLDDTTYVAGNVFLNVPVGFYTVYVTDSLGCTITQAIEVTGPAPLLGNPTVLNVQGETLGSILFSPTGGTSPYEYWVDTVDIADTSARIWVSTSNFDSLESRWYYTAVRDANGCLWESQVYVGEDVLDVKVITTDPLCYGDGGEVRIDIFTGTPPFELYFIGSSQPFRVVDQAPPLIDTIKFGLTKGTIGLHVVDITGVYYDTIVTVNEPDEIELTTTVTSKTCQSVDLDGNRTFDGTILTTATGGVGDLTYDLYSINIISGDFLQESKDTGWFDGLGEYLWYRVVVTDTNECVKKDSVGIGSDHIFSPRLGEDTTVCKNGFVQLFSGEGNYETSVIWEPDTLFENPDDVTYHSPSFIATYPVEVTMTLYDDVCKYTDTKTINLYDTVGMSFDVTGSGITWDEASNTVFAGEGNMIEVNMPNEYYLTALLDTGFILIGTRMDTGFFPPTPDDTAHIIYAYPDEPYYLGLGMTLDGCYEGDTLFVELRSDLSDTLANVFTPNGDNTNEYWVIENANQYPDIEVEVYDRWGQLVFYRKGYGQDTDSMWDGTSMKNGKPMPVGTYLYIIKLNDGMTEPKTGTVTIIR